MANFTIALKKKELIADGTWAFTFEKPEGFTFEAGQYVAMVIPRLVAPDKRGPVRSFSICSAPSEPDLLFAVRNTESPFKVSMLTLEPGETVQITKPTGKFTLSYAADGKPVVFLAGGIGITPVRSILIQAAHEESTRQFVLLYSNRFGKDVSYLDEIKKLRLTGLRCVSTLSHETTPAGELHEERGFINAAMIEKYCLGEHKENWYYVVGSPAFIGAMENILSILEVPTDRIVTDPFTGLESEHQNIAKE